MGVLEIFVLLFAFQMKHFLADYPLQNVYMLGKFKEKKFWNYILIILIIRDGD